MIKFFRNIRLQLLGEGKSSNPSKKVGTYLKYAIGEIILVVIGILIALSINNWNEKKIQNELVNTYLRNLIQDIKDDINAYQGLKNNQVFRFHSLQYLLGLANQTPVYLRDNEIIDPLTIESTIWNRPIPKVFDREFVELAFLWSIRLSNPQIKNTAIDELKSTGSFSLIENVNLKNDINEYYSTFEWRFGEDNRQYKLQIRNNWQEALLKNGILVQDISNVVDPINLIRDDLERIGYLRAIIRSTWFNYSSANYLTKKADELIESIELEISN